MCIIHSAVFRLTIEKSTNVYKTVLHPTHKKLDFYGYFCDFPLCLNIIFSQLNCKFYLTIILDMSELLEMIKYIVPLLVVLGLSWWLVNGFLKQERWRILEANKQHAAEALLKIRLQAYERVTLFLERINPQQLVLRVNNPDIDALALQRILLDTIRQEYEHNLVQQLYISPESWDLVEQARTWVVKLVNDSALELGEGAASNELAITIIEKEMLTGENKANKAILAIKKEVQALF
jgi:hypothetical protein